MEKIGIWCKMVSALSVVSALFLLMIPEGNLKKTFNILLTVIFIFALFLPLNGGKADLLAFAENIKINNNSYITDEYENTALIYAAQSETEKYLSDIFRQSGIQCTCEVICSYKNSKIHITEVTVQGDLNSQDRIFIERKIREISEEETKVIFKGGEYD